MPRKKKSFAIEDKFMALLDQAEGVKKRNFIVTFVKISVKKE